MHDRHSKLPHSRRSAVSSRSPRRRAAAVALLALAASGAVGAFAAAPTGLDASFGTGGFTQLPSGTQLNGLAVQRNGALLASGAAGANVLVERFTPAGQPDPRFGRGGRLTGTTGAAGGVALQRDGKIVVAATHGGLIAQRFGSTGHADRRFGRRAIAAATPLGPTAIGNAVAIDRRGRIVVAGSVRGSDGFTRLAVARFDARGRLDRRFGAGGTTVLDLGSDSVAEAVAIQPNGRIVIAGHQVPGLQVTNGLVLRLKDNGRLDPGFANRGVYFYYHPAGGGYSSLNALALERSGRIVAAGVDLENSGPHALFVRLGRSGAPDTSFNGSGRQALPSAALNTIGGDPLGAYGVAIAGGRILAAGGYRDSGLLETALWAVSTSGAPDTSLGVDGTVRTQINYLSSATALALTRDGSPVVVGSTQPDFPPIPTGPKVGFIARYNRR